MTVFTLLPGDCRWPIGDPRNRDFHFCGKRPRRRDVGRAAGRLVYGTLKLTVGIRLKPEEERRGADLSIHNIGANPEAELHA